MSNTRLTFRDKRGRFAKHNTRRVQTLEVRKDGVLLSTQRGRFSLKRSETIKRTAVRKAEAEKVDIILEERPYVRGAEKIEREPTGIFKVTIRGAKTRTILRIRKEGNIWRTIRKSSSSA